MNYIGIDPSFTRTGIAVICSENRELKFHTLSNKIGKKDFPNIFESAKILSNQLTELLSIYFPYVVVMEYAPPIASMSPALFSLDTAYAYSLGNSLVEMYHPMTLNKILDVKKKNKSDSIFSGKLLVKSYIEKGFSCKQKKICHDCFEALLYINYYIECKKINL